MSVSYQELKMKNKIIALTAAMVLALSSFAASVETDRTWYLAGEAMKVDITADNALIVYAELCDTKGLAAGDVVGLYGGRGIAKIELPSDMHSGYYVLSVYTRGNAPMAQQLVAVVNPLRKSADDDIEWVSDETSFATADGAADWLTLERGRPRLQKVFASPLSSLQSEAAKPSVPLSETEGHIVKARVKNVYEGHTYKGNQIRPSLSIVGKQIHYFEGKMVDDSTAVFFTFGVQGKLPLVLSAITSSGVNLPIEMISPFATLLPKSLPRLVFHYKRNEVETRSIDMQRHQKAIAPAKREGSDDDATEEGLLLDYDNVAYDTKPYLTYNLDEYRQFMTIREVLLEYVECVSNKKIKGIPHLMVHTKQSVDDSSRPTLVLIDSMPVYDIEQLLNYDARRLHYINIYDGQYTFGNGVYNGILSFVTRSGRLTNYPTTPNGQYLVYDFP